MGLCSFIWTSSVRTGRRNRWRSSTHSRCSSWRLADLDLQRCFSGGWCRNRTRLNDRGVYVCIRTKCHQATNLHTTTLGTVGLSTGRCCSFGLPVLSDEDGWFCCTAERTDSLALVTEALDKHLPAYSNSCSLSMGTHCTNRGSF